MFGNLDMVFFLNLGVEVIDGVFKLVKVVIGRLVIIVFEGFFYGCILGVIVIIVLSFKYWSYYELILGEVYYVFYLYLS